MVIVLKGIIIAATKGIKLPVTANDNPTTLYKRDKTKLIFIIVIELRDNFKK